MSGTASLPACKSFKKQPVRQWRGELSKYEKRLAAASTQSDRRDVPETAKENEAPAGRRASGAGIQALRRFSEARRTLREAEEAGRPKLGAVLQDLSESTPGGVRVPLMQVALSSEGGAEHPVTTATAVQEGLDAALLAKAGRRPKPVIVRPTRERLEDMEHELYRELVPRSPVAGKLLRSCATELKLNFSNWDLDGDGTLSKGELLAGINGLGLVLGEEEVDECYAWYDWDASGTLDREEFDALLRGLSQPVSKVDKTDEIRAFRKATLVRKMARNWAV